MVYVPRRYHIAQKTFVIEDIGPTPTHTYLSLFTRPRKLNHFLAIALLWLQNNSSRHGSHLARTNSRLLVTIHQTTQIAPLSRHRSNLTAQWLILPSAQTVSDPSTWENPRRQMLEVLPPIFSRLSKHPDSRASLARRFIAFPPLRVCWRRATWPEPYLLGWIHRLYLSPVATCYPYLWRSL